MSARATFCAAGIALTLALAIPVLFRGLDRRDLENDEAIHAQVVESILRSGDWFELRNPYGGPFLEKPPLKFWLVAAAMASGALPDDERGMRTLDAVLATVALVYLFLIGDRLAGVACGLTTVVLLLANERWVFEHGLRTHNLEASLVLAYAGGIFHLLAALDARDDRRSRRHIAAVGAWFGFAFLAKFVAAAFLPAIVAATAMIDANLRARLWAQRRHWLVAAGVAGAMILPYLVAYGVHFGPRFAREVVGDHVIRRFAGQLDPRHLQPADFYWRRAWEGLAAARWLLLVGALPWAARAARPGWVEGRVVTLWFLLPTVMLSWPEAKLGHYIYPFLPPLAMIAGYPAARLLTWAGGIASARDLRAMPSVRWLALTAAAFATLIALITASGVHVAIPLGPFTLRATAPLRACLIAVALVALSRSSLRVAAAFGAALIVATMGAAGWSQSLRLATRPQTMIRDLTACLARAGGAAYVHLPPALPLMNDVRWYFERSLRVERASRFENAELRARFDLAEPTSALVVFDEEYTRLRDDASLGPLLAPFPPHRLYNTFLLLPGRYAACAPLVPDAALVPGEVRR